MPMTGEPKYTDSTVIYVQPVMMEQVDPNNRFNRDGTIEFVKRVINTHAEAASEQGAEYLANSAAKHWNMSRNDPRFPTHPSTLRSQLTHLSTLCSTLIPCACFFARVNCRLKTKFADFFNSRYKNQRTVIETPSGLVLKTITPLFRRNGNTFPEFSQYIDYEGTRIASLQRPFKSQTTTIAARDSFYHKPCILSIFQV